MIEDWRVEEILEDPYLESTDSLERAREWVQELIHHAYHTGDMTQFENALEELAAEWNISLPMGKLKLDKIPGENSDEK